MSRIHKLTLACLTTLLAGLALAGPAAAVLDGRNGRIAFTSGREGANDNQAQLYLINPSAGNGALSEPFGIPGMQNRHPSFSPDRTKVVFAAGTPGAPATEEFDLFVKDFVSGTVTPLDINQLGDGLSSDHPAWSPDGTRIAYEQQPTDNSTDRNIMVKFFFASAPATPLTTAPTPEFKPAWSPDSQTIYYAKTIPAVATPPTPAHHDIVSQPVGGGTETPVVSTTADEYQPSLSPDGTKLCFTKQTPGDSSTAEIFVAPLANVASGSALTEDTTKGDINCTWSPNGRKIAYTNGTFMQGRLMVEAADNSDSIPTPITDDVGSNNFDGNADWAPDGSPRCPDKTVTTRPGRPITIELECVDTGPAYERTNPNGTRTQGAMPENGVISDEEPLADPSTLVYTPRARFIGVDRIPYTAFDDFGFADDEGTITIRVVSPKRCGGLRVTIIGTSGADVLRGTPRRDVILAGPGRDRVRPSGGRDIVCGGAGADVLAGGAGKDRLLGQRGNDRLNGGAGRDRLAGGPGRDRLSGGPARDRCAGGPGRDSAKSCEVSR